MAPLPKTPSLLPEIMAFVRSQADTPYEKLREIAVAAGWTWRLRQAETLPMPDASLAVAFELWIGKDDRPMELFDTISLRVPPNIGVISLAARSAAEASVLGAVFDRFPPAQMASPPAAARRPEPAAEPPDTAIHVNGTETGAPPWDDVNTGGEYVPAPSVALDVIDSREPDGLPIFGELYELGVPTRTVITAVLDEVGNFLRTADSMEQIDALARKNPDMMSFVRDLGTDSDKQALRSLVEARREELRRKAAGVPEQPPHRRRVEVQ